MSITDPDEDYEGTETSERPEAAQRLDDARRAVRMLNDIIRATPRSDPRLPELFVLRKLLDSQSQRLVEAEQQIAEFDETYRRLTSPANRLAVYLGRADGDNALIAMGDQEYVSSVDPALSLDSVDIGARVTVNDAFTVVGDLGYHPGGSLAKVQEVIGEDSIRINTDPQGSQSRILLRSTRLRGMELRAGDEVRVEPNYKVAIEHFPTKDIQEYFLEDVPEIPWSQIGGQDHVISVIKDAIELPLIHPELYQRFEKRPLKGILLYGPPDAARR
ncbi:MAG: hypothetical protein GX446_17320 [Chthonomonadales bacterium]|nr:hypothetical protein [Chthonomonadales bacterium]